jgi:hypothetical protein
VRTLTQQNHIRIQHLSVIVKDYPSPTELNDNLKHVNYPSNKDLISNLVKVNNPDGNLLQLLEKTEDKLYNILSKVVSTTRLVEQYGNRS